MEGRAPPRRYRHHASHLAFDHRAVVVPARRTSGGGACIAIAGSRRQGGRAGPCRDRGKLVCAKQMWTKLTTMTTVQPLQPPEMAAWHALVRGFATVARSLEGELETEHGLSLA